METNKRGHGGLSVERKGRGNSKLGGERACSTARTVRRSRRQRGGGGGDAAAAGADQGSGGGGNGRTMRGRVLGDAPPWSARTPWRLCKNQVQAHGHDTLEGGTCSGSATHTPTRSRLHKGAAVHKEQCAFTHCCSPTHARHAHKCTELHWEGGTVLTKTYRHQCGATETQRRA